MSSYIKIGVIVLGLLLVVVLLTKQVKDQQSFKQLEKAIKEKDQTIRIISDNNLEMKDRVVSKEVAEILYKNQIDSISKLLKVKPKYIKQYVTVKSEMDANISAKNDTFYNPETKIVDSLSISYKDEWINIKGVVTKEISKLQISGEDNWVISHIEKGNDIIVSVKNTNKYIHLTGASSLTITKPKPPIFQVQPFLGVGYDPFEAKVHPIVGIGVTINIRSIFKK